MGRYLGLVLTVLLFTLSSFYESAGEGRFTNSVAEFLEIPVFVAFFFYVGRKVVEDILDE